MQLKKDKYFLIKILLEKLKVNVTDWIKLCSVDWYTNRA